MDVRSIDNIDAVQSAIAIAYTQFKSLSIENVWTFSSDQNNHEPVISRASSSSSSTLSAYKAHQQRHSLAEESTFTSLNLGMIQIIAQHAMHPQHICINMFNAKGECQSIPLYECAKMLPVFVDPLKSTDPSVSKRASTSLCI